MSETSTSGKGRTVSLKSATIAALVMGWLGFVVGYLWSVIL